LQSQNLSLLKGWQDCEFTSDYTELILEVKHLDSTEYTGTALRIILVARELIQCQGYNAVSFNDIAQQVGIKKPSIVHHFASKSELGVAVVRHYRDYFSAMLDEKIADPNVTAIDLFDFYCVPYIDFGDSNNKICLCGALAGEFMALPETIQAEVDEFFKQHIEWLQKLLKQGEIEGVFAYSQDTETVAKNILSALQGALMVKRATNDAQYLADTIQYIKSNIVV